MKKLSVIGATLLGATVLFAAPIRFIYPKTKVCLCPRTRRKPVSGDRYHPGIAGVHRRYERRAYRHGSYGQGYSGSGGSYGASQGYVPAGPSSKEAAKIEFPTERKTRRSLKRACKQAWKAQSKGS